MDIKFFIGPMSKNIVDSIIEFQTDSKNKIGLIPSRRQVDFNGGYANKWTTKGLSDYAKDLLYGKAQWFMAENKVKRSGVIRTTTSPYDWVTDNLSPESNWKK